MGKAKRSIKWPRLKLSTKWENMPKSYESSIINRITKNHNLLSLIDNLLGNDYYTKPNRWFIIFKECKPVPAILHEEDCFDKVKCLLLKIFDTAFECKVNDTNEIIHHKLLHIDSYLEILYWNTQYQKEIQTEFDTMRTGKTFNDVIFLDYSAKHKLANNELYEDFTKISDYNTKISIKGRLPIPIGIMTSLEYPVELYDDGIQTKYKSIQKYFKAICVFLKSKLNHENRTFQIQKYQDEWKQDALLSSLLTGYSEFNKALLNTNEAMLYENETTRCYWLENVRTRRRQLS